MEPLSSYHSQTKTQHVLARKRRLRHYLMILAETTPQNGAKRTHLDSVVVRAISLSSYAFIRKTSMMEPR